MTNWSKEYSEKWQQKAKNYPTKALLVVAQKLSEQQEARVEAQKLKLDGGIWRRED
ncbi:hypothetical protein HZY88_07315 [Aerococcaceae bacterium DSM 111176]|nr:hypothetical protein [Aerococcaceae bacterium DSM 111176]